MQINILMRSRLIITIPHFNNPTGLMLTIGSINESFSIDIIVVDDGSKNIFNERLCSSIALTLPVKYIFLRDSELENNLCQLIFSDQSHSLHLLPRL